jgi:uncharacterized membrane protein
MSRTTRRIRKPVPRRLRFLAVAVFGTALIIAATSAAALGSPVAPPPVTILTSHGHALRGDDVFITPTGDSSTYANGPDAMGGDHSWRGLAKS